MQHKIQKITLMSDKENAKVFLAGEKDSSKLFILKEIYGEDVTGIYKQLRKVPSPFLPVIYDVFFQENMTIVLEEYIEGETLAQRIEKRNLNESDALHIMTELCKVLTALHSNKPPIIHRDVKPENIIITSDGSLKLIDADAARIYKENSDKDTRFLGTRGYASPEQFGFAQTDARSDIYSVGIVLQELWELGCFDEKHKRKIHKIIEKSTMFDPSKRYPTIEHMQRDIAKMMPRQKRFGFSVVLPWTFILFLVCTVVTLWHRAPTAVYSVDTAEKEITTASTYTSSFKAQCSKDVLFFYLGHPQPIDTSLSDKGYWQSMNPEIATVENGVVTGWKEGVTEIIHKSPDGSETEQWQIAVTTWNDGKTLSDPVDEDTSNFILNHNRKSTICDPKLAQVKINTMTDAVDYLRTAMITYDDNAPILINGRWVWSMSGETVLEYRRGGIGDIANLLTYLLQYDYEDSGFIFINGTSLDVLNWFYEDGTYYIMDCRDIIARGCLKEDVPYDIIICSDMEEIEECVKNVYHINTDTTVLISMVSSQNQAYQPAIYLSYMASPSMLFTTPVKIGFEASVAEQVTILFKNEAADVTLVPFTLTDMPQDIPTYEKRLYYE